MDQREFNRSMSSYLRERKTGARGLLDRIKRSSPQVQIIREEDPLPETIPVEQVQAVMRGERVAPVEPEAADEEFVVEDTPRRRGGVLTRIMGWFSFDSSSELTGTEDMDSVDLAVLDEERKKSPAVDDDVKEMLRTCVGWINRLPPEDIQDIRRSDEYVQFKRLLDKYGLIKK